MIKTLNLKSVIMQENQNAKTFLLKALLQIGPKKIFVIKGIKNTVTWTYVVNDLNDEEIIGLFYEKELQKTNQQKFRMEKVIKKKETSYMSNGKDMIIHLIAGLIKKT